MDRRNSGDGSPLTYGRPGAVADLCVCAHSSPAPVDWDGDGRLELLVGSAMGDGGIWLYRVVDFDAQGRPLFDRGEQLGSVDSKMRITGLFGAQIQVVDLNGEGLFDILSCYGFLTYNRDPMQYVHLYTNVGIPGHPEFGPPSRLEADGSVIDFSPGVYMVDWDSDGLQDLLLSGFGHSDPYPTDSKGNHIRGLYDHRGNSLSPRGHGYVRFYKNVGSAQQPAFADRGFLMLGDEKLEPGGAVLAADLNGDGLLDLICGQGPWGGHGIWFYRNVGAPGAPRLAEPTAILNGDGEPVRFHQSGLRFCTVDWHNTGKSDLLVGCDDGYVFLLQNLGLDDQGQPRFTDPVPLQQMDPFISTGTFSVPAVADWNDSGKQDLILGSQEGFVYYLENIGTGSEPMFNGMTKLEAGGEQILVQSFPDPEHGRTWGGAQDVGEYIFGYTQPLLVDWDGDGLLDLITGDILGQYTFYRNIGTRTEPKLAPGERIQVDGKDLITDWRVRPAAVDWTGNGRVDLIALDSDGYIALYERYRDGDEFKLKRPVRFRFEDGSELKLTGELKPGGGDGRGRIKLVVSDWDGDGDGDLIVGTNREVTYLPEYLVGVSTVVWLENVGSNTEPVFAKPRYLLTRDGEPIEFGWHTAAPEVVDWNLEGRKDLLVGTEGGRVFYYRQEHFEK